MWQVCIAKQCFSLKLWEKRNICFINWFRRNKRWPLSYFLFIWKFDLPRFCKRKILKNKRLFSYVFDNFCCIIPSSIYSWFIKPLSLTIRIKIWVPTNSWKNHAIKSCLEILFFHNCPELPKPPKQKNLCSKMWLIDQLYIKLGILCKGRFFQKVMAKFSNLSNRHACEPKIVSELLFPVKVINTIWATFWIHLA